MRNRASNPDELVNYQDPGTLVYVDDADGEGNPSLFTPRPASESEDGAIGNGTGDFIIWVNHSTLVQFPS